MVFFVLSFPCETAVWKTLPSIRAALARALIVRGLAQRRVAELLATTEATISHYQKRKRGNAVKLEGDILEAIDTLADELTASKIPTEEVRERICRLCNKATKTTVIC